MSDEINYKSNPLHGVSLKNLLTELVDHYGFEILHAYLDLNCFKTNPSIASSIKFLSKTDWAREAVENFYLYQFKSLPRASNDQFALPPRDRVIPPDQVPGPPAVLSLEDAAQLRAKREAKAANFRSGPSRRNTPHGSRAPGKSENRNRNKPRQESDSTPSSSVWGKANPWGKGKRD